MNFGKILLGWFGDLTAAMAGELLVNKTEKKDSKESPDHWKTLLDEAKEAATHEQFDRAGFLTELDTINQDTEGEVQPIFDLFDKFWKNKGIIWIGRGKERRSYRENQVGHLLLQIPVGQRQTEYPRLARTLKKDPKKFFAILEILNDDKITQLERQIVAEFEDSALGKAFISVSKEIAEPLNTLTGEGGSLRELRDRLRERALR